MPSIVQNKARWTEYPWSQEGHEWSPGGTAAGGNMLWWRALLPRIHRHLPAGRVLEIAPGFGRWTSHLVSHASRLVVVDLTERCIEHCRKRFADRTNIEYWTNDGQSLDMVEDGSVDFVFSFDSLVHAEAPVLRSYLLQLGRKLRPGGTGFIHHSNLRGLAEPGGDIPSWLAHRSWRAESMSAQRFREYCREAGLECQLQEIVNWIRRGAKADRHRIPGVGVPMTDTFSTFSRPSAPGTSTTQVYVNPSFVEEWRQCITMAALYGTGAFGQGQEPAAASLEDRVTPGLARRACDRLSRDWDYATSFVRDRASARRVRRSEPILNSLRRGACPDCRRRLVAAMCSGCRAAFRLAA